MSASSIITIGYGSSGTPSMVVTLGYSTTTSVDLSESTGDWTPAHRNNSFESISRKISYQPADRKISYNADDRD